MIMLLLYVLMVLALIADFYTTHRGIQRGATEGGLAKTDAARGLVVLIIAGGMFYSLSTGVNVWVAGVVMVAITASRFYAAWRNHSIARK